MKRLMLLFVYVLLINSTAQAELACGTVFSEGLSLSVGKFSKENQDSPVLLDELTAKILSMSAFTTGESMSPKITSEKGKMTLGKRIDDGWSIELEYTQDLRHSEMSFHLSELSLVKPNGEKLKFGKFPTSFDGLSFNKYHFTPKELLLPEGAPHPFQVIQNLEAPTVITGKLLNNLDRWLPYIEFIKRADLRELNKEELTKTKRKAQLVSSYDFMKKVTRKQSYKFILLGTVMYLYSARPDLENTIFNEGTVWSTVLDNSQFHKLNRHEYTYLTSELENFLGATSSEIDVEVPGKKTRVSEKSYRDLSGILSILRALYAEERKYDLKNEIYMFSNGKISELSMKKISNLLNSDTELSALLIFYSPVSKRVLFVAPDLAMGESELKFFTFGADAESYPTLLKLIKTRLAERKAE